MMKRGRRKRNVAGEETGLSRFGISIPETLLKKFDQHLQARSKQNRSDAIRELICERLVQDNWTDGKSEQVATLTLVYEHQNADMLRKLADGKRALGSRLLSAMQFRLSPQHDLEVLALRGPGGAIRAEAEALRSLKGVVHGNVVLTTPCEP